MKNSYQLLLFLFILTHLKAVAQQNTFIVQGTSAAPCAPATGCFAPTVLSNGDFESGNTGFTTQFTPNNGTATCSAGANCATQNLCDGGYAVVNAAAPCSATWSSNIRDHTTGVGKMMLVSFPAAGNQQIWCQTVNLAAATDYCFGAYFMNLMLLGNTTGEPTFNYTLNGTLIDATTPIAATEQWQYRGFQFNSAAGGNVTICIENSNAGTTGFDAAIDDISLQPLNTGNTPPTAAADILIICNTSNSGSVDVLTNDVAGSSPLQNSSLSVVTQPPFNQGFATVNQALGTVTFTKAAGFTGTSSFQYKVCGTDGCCATASVSVSQNNTFCSINTAPSTNVCANALITFTPTAGFAAYQWSPNVLTTQPSGIATARPNPAAPITSTTYTVTVTDALGCTATSTAVITTTPVPPGLSVSVAANQASPICSGRSVTFTATATGAVGTNPSYQWLVNGANAGNNSASFVTSVLANNDVIGVRYLPDLVCAPSSFGSVQVQITPSSIPTLSLTASNTTICSGDNVTFTATTTNAGAAATYAWTLNGTPITGATSSTYSTTSLVNSDQINVTFTPSIACSTPVSITPTNPITITVNAAGGTPSLTLTPPSNPVCVGAAATFTATATGVGSSPTYQWLVNSVAVVGATNATFTSNTLANGDVITCTVTATGACATGSVSQSLTAQINSFVTPSLTLSTPITTVCEGSLVPFSTSNIQNAGVNPTFVWKVNGIVQNGAVAPTFGTSNLQMGDNVSVEMTSTAVCTNNNPATASIQITVMPSIMPTVVVNSLTSPLCSQQTAFFNATITPSGANPSYQWQVNGVNSGTNSPNFNVNTLQVGDSVVCIATSSVNCATNPSPKKAIIFITPSVTPQAIITANATTACAGQTFDFTASGLFTGLTPTYSWSLNGVQTAIGNTFSSNQLTNGDIISLEMTTSATCPTQPTATTTQAIQVQTIAATATLLYPDTCRQAVGHAVVMPNGTATTGVIYSYRWSNSETADTARSLLGNTKYVITVTDNFGCRDTTTLFVPMVAGVKINKLQTTSQYCGLGGVLLDGTAAPLINDPRLPHTYQWFDATGSPLALTDSLVNLTTGSYTVLVTDRSNCTATATGIVPPPIFPNVRIVPQSAELELGDSLKLTTMATASDVLTYNWNPEPTYCSACKSILVAPLQSAIYTVTVTNLANCTATATATITVRGDYNVFIPTIFTPNNDGLNDEFVIYSGPNVSRIVSLRIFNRWGEVVFQQNKIATSDEKTSWNGYFKEKLAPMGVYVYSLEVEYVNGTKQTFVGDVTLMQ